MYYLIGKNGKEKDIHVIDNDLFEECIKIVPKTSNV
jgi:hypothetical protein